MEPKDCGIVHNVNIVCTVTADLEKLAASTLRIADLTQKLRREGLKQVRLMRRLKLQAVPPEGAPR